MHWRCAQCCLEAVSDRLPHVFLAPTFAARYKAACGVRVLLHRIRCWMPAQWQVAMWPPGLGPLPPPPPPRIQYRPWYMDVPPAAAPPARAPSPQPAPVRQAARDQAQAAAEQVEQALAPVDPPVEGEEALAPAPAPAPRKRRRGTRAPSPCPSDANSEDYHKRLREKQGLAWMQGKVRVRGAERPQGRGLYGS
jgi:hypothetical protein